MAALALPPVAFAQNAEKSTELEPVTVTGQAPNKSKKAAKKTAPSTPVAKAQVPQPASGPTGETSTSSATGPVNGYVAMDTTAGSKTATPIAEIPQFVSVVGRNEIDAQGAQKADEALRYTSGVFAQPFGSDTDTNWLFIRGFQADATGLYQDGLPLFSYAFGRFYTDSFALERIEVLKGPASVLYGGSNPGGIVNFVSKRPMGEKLRYLEAGINDAGNAYLGFDIEDRAGPALDYRVTGRIAGGDDYDDFQDGFRGFISPTLKWSDAQTSFTLLANYSHIDETHGSSSFLPYVGTVVPASFGRIPRDANYTEPKRDNYEREQGSIGYEFEHKFSSDLVVRQNARFSAADVSEVNFYPNGYNSVDPTMLNRVQFAHDTSVSTFLLDNQVEWKTQGVFAEHTVLAGVDYKYFNIDQVQASGLWSGALEGGATPISVRNPIYGLPQPPLASYLNEDLTQEQIGAYIQDQIRFGGGWLVTLNGRYDWVSTEVKKGPNYYSPTTSSIESDDGEASGRAGLAYTFTNGLTPYVSAATYFNPQIGTTYEGNPFVPETGQQYEAGIKYAPKFLDAIITASLFDLTRQNVLTRNPNLALPGSPQVQTGEVNSRGFEMEAKANLTKSLRVTAAFTAFDIEVTKDNDPTIVGKRPFVVPEVMASAFADYTFRGNALDGISIGGGVRYIGSSYANSLNTLKVPDVTLFDAKIGYEWDNWGIDLNVTNVFDEAYVASCQGVTVCSYGEGRVVKLKTHVTW
jgi:iron complex outermembrane receptor protein